MGGNIESRTMYGAHRQADGRVLYGGPVPMMSKKRYTRTVGYMGAMLKSRIKHARPPV